MYEFATVEEVAMSDPPNIAIWHYTYAVKNPAVSYEMACVPGFVPCCFSKIHAPPNRKWPALFVSEKQSR